MKRFFVILEAAENELNGLVNIPKGVEVAFKARNIINKLWIDPTLPGFEKVRGLKKQAKVFKYNFQAFGTKYRLFYVYDKHNFIIIYFDNRDEKTYSKSQLKKLERLSKQARWRFIKGE